MPYWDFSTEHERLDDEEPYIFQTGLGGTGNPNDSFTVNSYSWPYTTKQYWVPAHCTAEGDEYPICSLKRATSWPYSELSAQQIGDAIKDNHKFKDFSRWYSDSINLPFRLLTSDSSLMDPGIN